MWQRGQSEFPEELITSVSILGMTLISYRNSKSWSLLTDSQDFDLWNLKSALKSPMYPQNPSYI